MAFVQGERWASIPRRPTAGGFALVDRSPARWPALIVAGDASPNLLK
jgi:hypothetical protein